MELKGKKINFLGDSITEGARVTDCAMNRYDNVLKRLCGLDTVRNYGKSGTRLACQTGKRPSGWDGKEFFTRAEIMDRDADVVVVFGGTNDYGHGDAPFGSDTDKEPTSFCGAVNHLMAMIKRDFPKSEIVFMTPMRRIDDEKISSSRIEDGNDAKALIEYVDYIIEAAKKYGIHTLDLYRTLPIDPNKENEKELYAPDGLHPNDLGQRVLAERLQEFLLAL